MTSKISAGGGNRLPRLHLTAVKSTAQFAIPKTVQGAAQTLSPAIQDQPQANMVPGPLTITTPEKVVRMDPSDPRHPILSYFSRVLKKTTAALRFTSCMFFIHLFAVEGFFTPVNKASPGFAVYTTLSKARRWIARLAVQVLMYIDDSHLEMLGMGVDFCF